MPHCAPVNPSLPQNDTPGQQLARAAQLDLTRQVYSWTTAVPSLPGIPVASGVPLRELPTLEWWVLLSEILVALVRNHLAVILAAIARGAVGLAPADVAAKRLACDAIEIEIAAIKARLAHNTSGGTVWSRIAADVELGVAMIADEAEAAKLKDHADRLCAMLELANAETAAVGSAFPRSLESYRALFQTIPLPAIGWTFQDDTEFARLRVAGPNPMLIKRIEALPENFPLTAQHYAAVVNGDVLAAALADGRLYLCDYAPLSELVAGSWQGQPKYVYRPMALFAVPPGGATLIPVAIQCDQDPSVNPLFTPGPDADTQWGWEIAKLIVQVADGNYHELFAHLAHTHLVIEALAVAARRHLAEVHPVWALLVPHFEGTLFINDAAATQLITAGGPIDHIFGGTIASSQQMAADARMSFDFSARMLPADLKSRGVDDPAKLPEFPYRDDGLLVWQAIHEWAAGYIGLYYANDAAVAGDGELAAWCADLTGPGRLAGFPTIATRSQLIDACTMAIFTASAQHAAVNFPQQSVMEFAPAVTGAGWEAAPMERVGHDRTDWLRYMPPSALALEQMETLNLLGSLHYRPLGTYQSRDFPYPVWFTDPAVTGPEGPLVRFQAALAKVEERIVARNAQRRVDYPHLLPSRIPTSTNI